MIVLVISLPPDLFPLYHFKINKRGYQQNDYPHPHHYLHLKISLHPLKECYDDLHFYYLRYEKSQNQMKISLHPLKECYDDLHFYYLRYEKSQNQMKISLHPLKECYDEWLECLYLWLNVCLYLWLNVCLYPLKM